MNKLKKDCKKNYQNAIWVFFNAPNSFFHRFYLAENENEGNEKKKWRITMEKQKKRKRKKKKEKRKRLIELNLSKNIVGFIYWLSFWTFL